jgi:hypothetical protein
MQTARSEQVEQRVAGCRDVAPRTIDCGSTSGQRADGGADSEESQAGSAYMIIPSSARGGRALFHQYFNGFAGVIELGRLVEERVGSRSLVRTLANQIDMSTIFDGARFCMRQGVANIRLIRAVPGSGSHAGHGNVV